MIYALVVVYNKKCEDSNSINDLKKYAPDISMVIYDNSTKNMDNYEYCKRNDYIYFTKHKNVGLSKAYNYVIKNMNFNTNDYLIMLDDDTHLNINYVTNLKRIVKENKYDIILPVVKANNRIISPYNYYMGCRSKMITTINQIDMKKVSGINSGMVIRTGIFTKITYNENLFLDYVDYDFMRKVHKINGKVKIMKTIIKQEFQYFNYDRQNITGAKIRFKIDMHDYKILCKETKRGWFFYIHSAKFMLQQTLKYRSLAFFMLLIKFWIRGK